MNYLLDTDHVSLLERKRGHEFDQLMQRLSLVDWKEVGVSVASYHEQSLGCNNYISQAKSQADVVRGYRMLHSVIQAFSRGNVVPFDLAAGTMFENLRVARIRIGTMDLRIAATALANNLILLTRNTVDFERVPSLRFEDWTK